MIPISATPGVNTLTLPAHLVGDVFYAFAGRDGAGGVPTIPTADGWSAAIDSNDANNVSFVVSRLVADSDSEVAGTWENATSLLIVQLRPGAAETVYSGAVAHATHGSNLTVNIPGLTLQNATGTSWVLAFFVHRANNLAEIATTALAGMVYRGHTQDGIDSAATYDTNGGVTSWSQQSIVFTGSASAYQSCALEIRVDTGSITARSFYYMQNQ